MKIRITELREAAKQRPGGYYEDVVSKGKVLGAFVILSRAEYVALGAKYGSASSDQVGNQRSRVIKGIVGLSKAVLGLDQARAEVIEHRRQICDNCEFMASKPARRCLKCGCFVSPKTTLNGERCPDGKW
jgi:hypothetical protein